MDQFCEVFKQAEGGVVSPGMWPSVSSALSAAATPFWPVLESPLGVESLRLENKFSPGKPMPSSMSIRLLSIGAGFPSKAVGPPIGDGRGSILILGCLMGVDVSRVRDSPEVGESSTAWDSLGLSCGGVTKGDNCKHPACGPARQRESLAACSLQSARHGISLSLLSAVSPLAEPELEMIISDDVVSDTGKFCFLRPLLRSCS